MLPAYKKSATVNYAVQTPSSLFFPSYQDILVFSKSFYSETLAKHPVYESDFFQFCFVSLFFRLLESRRALSVCILMLLITHWDY